MSEVVIRNGSRVEIAADYQELCDLAVGHIEETVRQHSEPVILWPEGNTQRGIKPLLAKWLSSLTQPKTIHLGNLDELCESDGNGGFQLIDADDSQSFRGKTDRELLSLLPPGARDNVRHHYPDTADPTAYDRLLYEDLEGVALVVDGLGEDDHIMGFNQCNDSLRDSRTRFVILSQGLRTSNGHKYKTAQPVPPAAVTVGIATCLSAEAGLTLVSGDHKERALRRAIYGNPDDYPSAYWQEHRNHLWLVDKEAVASIV